MDILAYNAFRINNAPCAITQFQPKIHKAKFLHGCSHILISTFVCACVRVCVCACVCVCVCVCADCADCVDKYIGEQYYICVHFYIKYSSCV